jgi:hypothetical protein
LLLVAVPVSELEMELVQALVQMREEVRVRLQAQVQVQVLVQLLVGMLAILVLIQPEERVAGAMPGRFPTFSHTPAGSLNQQQPDNSCVSFSANKRQCRSKGRLVYVINEISHNSSIALCE